MCRNLDNISHPEKINKCNEALNASFLFLLTKAKQQPSHKTTHTLSINLTGFYL